MASAPIASVFLVLTALAAATAHIPSGLPAGIVSRSGYPPGVLCVEQRLIIIRIAADRQLFINSEPVPAAMCAKRLEEIFRTRAERPAYVLGAPELSYGEVADVVDTVRRFSPNVYLLTPSSVPTMEQPLLRGAFPVKSHWQ
jgi:biopolymer transport protein ExbD